jgi:murein L,D-transpeptidase YcbB/YkuD
MTTQPFSLELIKKFSLVIFTITLLTTVLWATDDEVRDIIRERVEHVRQFKEMYLKDASVSGIIVLPEFYEKRNFSLAWNNPENIDGLIRIIDEMDLEGLTPSDYHRNEILFLKEQVRDPAETTPQVRADFDILLSDALLRIVYHMLFGKVDPERLDANWNIYKDIDDMEAVSWLQKTIDSPDIYQTLKSQFPEEKFFQILRKELIRYRSIAENGGWPVIPEGPAFKKGMADERIPSLRKQLLMIGDLTDSTRFNSEIYDETLEVAVKQFQYRHGLNPDGVIGKNTLHALNVPVNKRIDQILVNLERGRWIYRDIPDDYILVNIANFQANYVRNGRIQWRERAQVGKDYRQTPVFKADLKYLVFNPTWTVPPTILEKDVLPAIKKDIGYLDKKNMKVINRSGKVVDPTTVKWTKYTGKDFPYSIRQDPGPTNALGRVKFIFPNKHFVFLHDTPSKALFQRETRAFSSGCIRVEHPFNLAEAVLKDPENWSLEKIKQLISSEKMKTVYLKEPITVLNFYATAFQDLEQDLIHFRKDIYDRDQKILDELKKPFKRKERHLEVAK